MHMCTSNVYWITLKLFNKTINVEFCIYFVSLMKHQLQGQNKCKYIYASLLLVLNFSFESKDFIKCEIFKSKKKTDTWVRSFRALGRGHVGTES